MKIDDQKHKHCRVCYQRLDRVNRYSKIQSNELIEKVNNIKAGIVEGDFVCSKCTQLARSSFHRKVINNSLDDAEHVAVFDETINNNDSPCMFLIILNKNYPY